MAEKTQQGTTVTIEACPICEGKGYNRRASGHVIGGAVHSFGVGMQYCRCSRGRELEQLVAQEVHKGWQTGVQAGRAGA